jgi:hypothetical protein
MSNINPVLAAARQTSSVIQNNSQEMVDLRGQQAQLENSNAAYEIDMGVNQALIDSTKQMAEYATQRASAAAGAAFGTDMRLQSNVITGVAQAQAEAYQRKLQSSAKIAEFDAKNPLDNIIGSIFDGFARNAEIGNYYAAERDENNATAYLQEINEGTRATIANQKAMEVSMSQESIQAQANKTLELAQQKANLAKIQGLGFNIDALNIAKNASVEQTDLKFKVLSAQNGQEQLRLALARESREREQFDWQKAKKATEDAGDAYTLERLKTGYQAIMGDKAPDFSNPSVAKRMLAMLKVPGEPSAEVKAAWEAGSGIGIISPSASGMVNMIKAGVPVQFNPAQAPVKQLFEDTMITINQEIAGRVVDKKTVDAATDLAVMRSLEGMLKEVKPGDPKNLFNIQSVESIFKAAPAVAALPLSQKVLIPAGAAGLDDPNKVFNLAVDAARAGKISFQEAYSGYVALYQRGVDLNLAAKNLPSVGLVPAKRVDPATGRIVGDWHSYTTSVETSPTSVWGKKELLDNTNLTEVKRAMMKSFYRDTAIYNRMGIEPK